MTAAIEDGSLFSEQDLEEQIQQIGDMTLDAPGQFFKPCTVL